MSHNPQVVPLQEESTSQTSQGSIEDLAMVAADSSPLGKEREEQKRRFEIVCRKLSVTERTRVTAWNLLCKIPVEECTPDNENTLTACSLYIASKTEGKGNGVSLTQLLRETRIKMIDFFEPLKSFISLLQLNDFEEQLKFLEKKFVVISILFQKYEKLFDQLFNFPLPSFPTPDSKSSKSKLSEGQSIFTFGWSLFLVSKGKLLKDPPDLLNAFHVLLCCINLLLMHTSSSNRKLSIPLLNEESQQDLDQQQQQQQRQEQEDNRHISNNSNNSLLLLCQLCNANYNDVLKVNDQLFVPFLLMLHKNNILKLSENAVPKNFDFSGLLEGNLTSNVNSISKEYDIMYYDTGDFDERLFIDQKDQIGTPSKVPSQTRSYYHLRTKGSQSDPSQLMSPYKSALLSSSSSIPGSPMSTTINTVNLLKNITMHTGTIPSPNLLRFFKSCTKDVTSTIEERVVKLSGILRDEGGNEEQRVELGIKLYYKILESMLSAEEQRLKLDNFTTLLSHENFHRSLLACTMEIVLFAYKMTQMSFPYILEKFQLKPFDFCKIIESVVRHEPELPKAIIKHLSTIEEKILESMAWEDSSPLISLLQDKNNQQSIVNTLLSPSKSKAHSMQALSSPGPSHRLLATDSSSSNNITTTTASTSTSTSRISHSLELFLRKVIQISSQRSKDICCRLQIPPKIYQQVWQAILHILTERSSIMVNRHLDQIIMCSLYGVSRVNQLKDITFKNIIEQYKSQPQASSKVYREVLLSKPGEYSDIISFYNTVFIPQMESFLLQFQTLISGSSNAVVQHEDYANSLPLSPNKYNMHPPYSPKILTNVNLYLSPMRSRQSSNTMNTAFIDRDLTSSTTTTSSALSSTPKFLYSFGESPAKELQSINVSINAKSATKSKPKRLLFSENGSSQESEPSSPLLGESPSLKRRHNEITSIVNSSDMEEGGKSPAKKLDIS